MQLTGREKAERPKPRSDLRMGSSVAVFNGEGRLIIRGAGWSDLPCVGPHLRGNVATLASFLEGLERAGIFDSDPTLVKQISVLAGNEHPRLHNVTVSGRGDVFDFQAEGSEDGSIVLSCMDITCTAAHQLAQSHGADRGLRDMEALAEARASALSEKNGLIERAFENLTEGFGLFDPNDRLVFCNDTFGRIAPGAEHRIQPGLMFEDLVRIVAGRGGLNSLGDEETARVNARMAIHQDGGGQFEVEQSNGRRLLISERRAPDGSTIVVQTDITELRRHSEMIELLYAVLRATSEAETISEAFQRCLDEVGRRTRWPVGHVYIVDEADADLLKPSNIWYLADPAAFKVFKVITARTVFGVGEGLPGRVIERQEPVWVDTLENDKNFPRFSMAPDIGVKAGFGVPVNVNGRCRAVLEFYSANKELPDPLLLDTLTHMASELGKLIDRLDHAEEIERARKNAEAASVAKSEFLSRMSHELRTPMNAILGFGQILDAEAADRLDTDQKDAVGHILASGDHLLQLIDEVLDLASVEAGEVKLRPEIIEPSIIIESCLALAQSIADKAEIQLAVTGTSSELAEINVDPLRVKQVLLNLLSNAVKYNSVGGSVTVDWKLRAPEHLRIQIHDTGDGIAPTERELVFEPFGRLPDHKDQIDGTGIGLAISKQMIEMMGGAIGFDSIKGAGTKFWIDLPLAQ